ncbi:DNA polymerase IV [Idiomarina tyrosinivorans]|uniref:DNA polymerase IV n=1 Tax=Idiomarina tyrosinivorans TaxID=1445662 RepID=A0A432ZT44_9GAMM|nr:DNA polymerase IV [Idiomarina tyrosinivorans]RUO81105.1 DNA polymerase IV [Idiomarina tyrosinivorans]
MSESPRKIALLDLDAFFAAAEVLRDPSLAQRPFAVGGGENRGVVATANYLARQFGVHSAMPGSQAKRLCPELLFVRPDHGYYRQLSSQVLQVLQQVTETIEPASIDEFYLDLTDNQHYQGSATRTMSAIRDQLRELGLSASAGISNQKMVAKIASEERKPDGQFVVPPEQVLTYISQLSLKKIPGVGPKSQQRLALHGFHKGQDIQQAEMAALQDILGEKAGYILHQRCLGIDPRQVITERIRKSVGVEETLSADMLSSETGQRFLYDVLLPKLKKRLKIDRWQQQPIRAQTVKVKFSDFSQTTASKACKRVSSALFHQLLGEAWQRGSKKGVRLIGVSVTLPDPDEDRQLELELE